jgi:predicted anti-sigma-YlaC factor YlaD
MQPSNRLLGLVALVAIFGQYPLQAESPPDRFAPCAGTIVSRLRSLVRHATHVGAQDPSVRQSAQTIPTGGPTIDLSDLSKPTLIDSRLHIALKSGTKDLRLRVPGGTAHRGNFRLEPSQNMSGHLLVIGGNADIYGRLSGNLVTLDGDVVVHPGAVISGDVLSLGGEVRDEGGEIDGEARNLSSVAGPAPLTQEAAQALTPFQSVLRRSAGVLGVFLTLSILGFGLVMFGRPNLEIVSDTVSHSFGRAFVTGLLGQILLLPTFGMLVVGLILSVAGILLLPFAIAVFAMLAVVAVVGGYLAVAHAMGETYTRRRMALGVVIGSPNSYRYLLVGLLALASLWMAWALFGWVPVAGSIVWGAAFFLTWLLGTAGFGAALLSRAGVKENFAGRILPPEALTDEYLWATPQFGVPAARRPGGRTPSRGA